MESKKTALMLILCGVTLRVILLVMAEGTLIDDAYITLRSAENLLEGHGLTYNSTAPVLAVSGPLYGFWTAFLLALTSGRAPGYVIGATNIALFALAGWWLWKISAELNRRCAVFVLLVFALFVRFVDNTTTGMETPLFLAVILGALILLEKGRYAWLSLCLAASALLRPEGALLIPAVLVVLAIRRARLRWTDPVPGMALLAAWIVYSYSYYGSPIPHSLLAKSAWFYSVEEPGLITGAVQTFLSLSLFEYTLPFGNPAVVRFLTTVIGLASLALFISGFFWFVRERRAMAVFPLFFVFYVAFYIAGKGSTVFSWYGIPSGLAYLVSSVFGAAYIVRKGIARPLRNLYKPAVIGLTLILGLSSVAIWERHRMPYYRDLRESYGKAGEFVDRVAGPDDRLFTAEIGMIGYKARRPVYDMAGIASPEILELYDGRSRADVMLEVIQRYRPGYIVLDTANLKDLANSSDPEWVPNHYEEAARFSNHAVLASRR